MGEEDYDIYLKEFAYKAAWELRKNLNSEMESYPLLTIYFNIHIRCKIFHLMSHSLNEDDTLVSICKGSLQQNIINQQSSVDFHSHEVIFLLEMFIRSNKQWLDIRVQYRKQIKTTYTRTYITLAI